MAKPVSVFSQSSSEAFPLELEEDIMNIWVVSGLLSGLIHEEDVPPEAGSPLAWVASGSAVPLGCRYLDKRIPGSLQLGQVTISCADLFTFLSKHSL